MKVNSITNNKINIKKTFRGYSDPGRYAFSSQFGSAVEAERFLASVRAAKRQDAVSTNFITAFVNKLALTGEILGLRNFKESAEIMRTPEHKALVAYVDRSVESMLDVAGSKNSKGINLLA